MTWPRSGPAPRVPSPAVPEAPTPGSVAPGQVTLRAYSRADASPTLAVFLAAVTGTASAHYSPEQIAAWSAPAERNLDSWHAARARLDTLVAVLDGEIAGFSDVDAHGYIDMMFVAPRFGRRGVAGALLAELEHRARAAGTAELSVHASLTARPFFERHGFLVLEERHPVLRGVHLTNFRMLKPL